MEEKNRLILEVIPVARSLNPRIIVAENVRQILTLHVDHDCVSTSIVDILREELPEYEVFSRVVNVADYGIAQIRRRALIIAVHNQEPWLQSIIRAQQNPVDFGDAFRSSDGWNTTVGSQFRNG